jgi:Undecaprenyl-phosphate galactose phosphotransferase WbaP
MDRSATASGTVKLDTSNGTMTAAGVRRSKRWRLAAVLAATDVASILVAIALSGLVAMTLSGVLRGMPLMAPTRQALNVWVVLLVVLTGGLCGWFASKGHYTSRLPLRAEIPTITTATLIVLLLDASLQYALRERFSRLWMFSLWPMVALLLPLGRIAVRRTLHGFGAWMDKTIILGQGSEALSVAEVLRADRYIGYAIAAHRPIPVPSDGNWRKAAADTLALIEADDPDMVILAPGIDELPVLDHLIDTLNVRGMAYAVVPPLFRLPLAGLQTQTFVSSNAVLMTVNKGLTSPANRALKRAFDVVAAGTMIVFLAPVFLLTALAVRIAGAPVLFHHGRVGRNGQPFACFKFRTMVTGTPEALNCLLDADPAARQEWNTFGKLRRDPRVTRLGRILRTSSLDELPQLFNVLRGEMSLVGPRPVTPRELAEHYRDDAMYYRLVRPGVSGLWQVSGRNRLTYEKRVQMDAWYVRNWSLWMDIWILLKTVPSLIFRDGA